MSEVAAKKRSWLHCTGRALSAFGVTFSFFAILISGAVIYFAPKGQVSNKINWGVLGLDRHGWGDIHIIMGFLFAGFSIWHILLHWRVVKSFIVGNAMHPSGHRLEAMIVVAAVLFFVLATIWDFPPASWLLDLNRFFKQSFWVR